MFRIDLQNIQAIGSAIITIEDNTIVEFTGDNSNGKSVISKVIEKLTSGDIRNKEVRITLIKDGCDVGAILFTHNKEQLGIVLHREMKDSFVLYRHDITNEQDSNIIRPLNDAQGVREIVRQFGFRTYDNGSICLQLAPTFGAVPFVTTSGTVNDEIVQDITTDKVADEFLQSFKNITFKLFKTTIATKKQEREKYQAVLDNMESYNWKDYEVIYNKMKPIYEAIRGYEYMLLDEVPVPALAVLPVSHLQIECLPIVKAYELGKHIDIIGDELKDYVDVMNGVCPTCGRPLIECSH